ncbi:MAG: diguanylate cyclase [Magnetococcales bacterium]|nr:diguanylate cyclase [Magnetococcales bacterium]
MNFTLERVPVFLVDDQEITGYVLNKIFSEDSRDDFILHATNNPFDALQKAQDVGPAVILLDLVMPGMDGLTLLEQFRQHPDFADTPIIMLSSQEESFFKAKAFEMGANDYLVKLPEKIELLARLRYHASAYYNLLKNRESHRILKEKELQFRIVTQSILEAIVASDLDGTVRFWNQGAATLFGYTLDEMIGQQVDRLFPQSFHSEFKESFKELIATGGLQKGELREWQGIRKNGQEFPMEISINSWTEEGRTLIASVMRDITQRKHEEDRIRYQANYDHLTGLPNRNFFVQHLDESISLARRQSVFFSLLFIDLDRFKWVNDTLGHEAGDLLLQEVAKRMKHCIRTTDTLGRLGGDEFTAILYDVSPHGTRLVARKILDELARSFWLQGNHVQISGSIGITLYPNDGENKEILLKNADMAMYVSKNAGKNRYWFFNPNENQ